MTLRPCARGRVSFLRVSAIIGSLLVTLVGPPVLAQGVGRPPNSPLHPAASAARANLAKPGAIHRVWRPRPHGLGHGRRPAPAGALASIAAANAAARDWPRSGAYLNSALIYDYEPGRLYTIRTSPRFLTTITLRPGEKLIAKAAGDTVRWVLGETVEGVGDQARVVVLVKPVQAGLRTNIVLTTDQRTYLIDAVSGDGDVYTSLLAWNYPFDQARELAESTARASSQAQVAAASSVDTGLAVDRLNFHYRVETTHGRSPHWQPLRVFDDGSKTYVEFPADLGTSEAPPLFLVGEKGEAELVNYRVRGVYYVVDRLLDVAELRLGDKSQTVVRITRLDAARLGGPRP
jgi:type IV secretion system protein VirB9